VGAVQQAQQVAGIMAGQVGLAYMLEGTHTSGGLVGSVCAVEGLSDSRGYFISARRTFGYAQKLLVRI
jgi:hypothetical protein